MKRVLLSRNQCKTKNFRSQVLFQKNNISRNNVLVRSLAPWKCLKLLGWAHMSFYSSRQPQRDWVSVELLYPSLAVAGSVISKNELSQGMKRGFATYRGVNQSIGRPAVQILIKSFSLGLFLIGSTHRKSYVSYQKFITLHTTCRRSDLPPPGPLPPILIYGLFLEIY